MIKFKLKEGVIAPKYATAGSSGADIRANSVMMAFKGDVKTEEEVLDKMQKGFVDRGYIKVRPFERILFGTGIFIEEMSDKLEIVVRPRSGLSLKKGLFVANSPGTVDSDYKGEIGVILYNSSPFLTKVEFGERIAQIVLQKVEKIESFMNQEDTIERGVGGFGSTGKN